MNFESIYKKLQKEDKPFIAKMFGIIGEEIVSIWLRNSKCQYMDTGRPTVYSGKTKATLDFTFLDKSSNRCYMVEQKNLLSYHNEKLRKITNTKDFWGSFDKWSNAKQKSTDAWDIFLKFPKNTILKQKRNEQTKIWGRILIWGSCDEAGRKKMMKKFHFYDILSLENIVKDLMVWKDVEYVKWRSNKNHLVNNIFDNLKQG
jgi:hypothetical protein